MPQTVWSTYYHSCKNIRNVHIPQLESSYQNRYFHCNNRNIEGGDLDSKQGQRELKSIPGNQSNSVQRV